MYEPKNLKIMIVNIRFLADIEFWYGILAIIGFIYCLTSFGKFIANLMNLIWHFEE